MIRTMALGITDRKRKRERERVCVCLCEREREKERERRLRGRECVREMRKEIRELDTKGGRIRYN